MVESPDKVFSCGLKNTLGSLIMCDGATMILSTHKTLVVRLWWFLSLWWQLNGILGGGSDGSLRWAVDVDWLLRM